MSLKYNKAFVWPPVKSSMYGSTLSVKAYFSWFFGHLFNEIYVPVIFDAAKNANEWASSASLVDADKTTLINADKSFEANFNDFDICFITSNDLASFQNNAVMHRHPGSIRINIDDKQMPAQTNCQYYYIGNPVEELQDAYFSACFTYWTFGGENHLFLEQSKQALLNIKAGMNTEKPLHIFGTGPSVYESLQKPTDNLPALICNTIVKNKSLCKSLDLKIIFAADAHYHFSYHRYSARLLSDIYECLNETNASFFTFDKFAIFLINRLNFFKNKVFGIPPGRKTYGYNLDKTYKVLPGDSVVNMFMLPVGMFLSNNIVMNGFTGRSKNDDYFWSHSDIHQYSHLLEDVRKSHPAFFKNRDYDEYANNVEEQLNHRVNHFRKKGNSLVSGTTSFYKSLNESYGSNID
jgi:hypothetical protein